MKNTVKILLLIPFIAAGLAGCSGDSSESGSDTASIQNETSSVTESETSATASEDPSSRSAEDKFNARMVGKLLDTISSGAVDHSDFFSYVEQKYKFGYKSETENESVEFLIDTYMSGMSVMDFGSDNASDAGGGKSFFDISLYEMLKNGDGHLDFTQEEKTDYSYKSVSKTGSKEETKEAKKYEVKSDLIIKSDNADLYVQNKTTYSDQDGSSNIDDSFNGKIKKNDFLEYASEDYVETIRRKTMFLDALEYLAQFSYMASSYKDSLDLNDPSAVNEFIKNNGISFSEDEVGRVVSFEFKTDDMFAEITDQEIKDAPVISGRVIFDGEKEELLIFDYDFKDYFKYNLGLSAEGREITELTVDDYIVKGISLDIENHDVELDKDFTEYDDPVAFLADMDEHLSVISDMM
ncbi:MAG: hypothetical protein IKP95_11160 [Ruminococcus sp.]|nr:hypothetical protein [Ruminococcus sp.]